MLFLTILVTIIIASLLRGVLIMVLWNWLLPALLHVPEISILEGIGLYMLVALLFGNLVDKNVLPKSKEKAKL